MKNLILLLLFIFTCDNVYSQADWFWQNPLPQGNQLYGLEVFDQSKVFCVNGNSIMKTTDGGDNWNTYYTGFNLNNGNSFMFDQNNGIMCSDPNTLIQTSNGGVNWTYLSQDTDIQNPKLYFIDHNVGFLLGRNSYNNVHGTKLMRTSDGGINWTVTISDTTFELYEIFFPDLMTGYCVGSKYLGFLTGYQFKLFKTTDKGISWDSISNPFNLDGRSIFFINDDTGFAGGSSLYKTYNGGINWVLLNNSTSMQLQFINSQTGYTNFNGISKTTNGGINWSTIYGNELIDEFYFFNENVAYTVGAAGSMLKTTNGGLSWESKSFEVTHQYLFDIEFSDANTGFAVGESGIILKTINGGNNWSAAKTNYMDELTSVSKVDPLTWFISCYNPGKVYKTTNGGISWDTTFINRYGINEIEFINALTGFGICKYTYFLKTTNGGQSWIVNNNLTGGQNWGLDFIDENTGYVGGNSTRKTTDGGVTWNTLSVDHYAFDLQFVNYNTGFIVTEDIVGGINYYEGVVLKTTNAGLNWVSTSLGTAPLWNLYFVNPQTGFVTNGSDIYKTTTGGDSWFGFKTCSTNYLSTVYFQDSVTGYCVGDYGTIIKTTNGGGQPVSIAPITNEVPAHFNLIQNFPNPFNPNTIIEYHLSARSDVSLRVYDILGKEVITLINKSQSAGNYKVEFDGSNFSSGIYFYRLIANEFTETKRMMLLK